MSITSKQKENVTKLIAALRSGKYKQARFKLSASIHNEFGVSGEEEFLPEVGFCCLGVACDLSGLGTWSPPPAFLKRKIYVYEGMEGSLPATVMAHYGFPNARGFTILDICDRDIHDLGRADFMGLDTLNDTKPNLNFNEIADVIEYWLNNQVIEN